MRTHALHALFSLPARQGKARFFFAANSSLLLVGTNRGGDSWKTAGKLLGPLNEWRLKPGKVEGLAVWEASELHAGSDRRYEEEITGILSESYHNPQVYP